MREEPHAAPGWAPDEARRLSLASALDGLRRSAAQRDVSRELRRLALADAVRLAIA